MKPCRDQHQSLALHAAGCLTAAEAAALEQHLSSCAGCQTRYQELLSLAGRHSEAAADRPGVSLPTAISQRIAQAIRRPGEAAPSLSGSGAGRLRWQRTLATAAALVVLGALAVVWSGLFSRPVREHAAAPVEAELPSNSTATRLLRDTQLGSYRKMVVRSPDLLEQALAQQAAYPNPPLGSYRLRDGWAD